MMTKFMNKQRGLLAAIMALVMVFAGAAFVAAEVDADASTDQTLVGVKDYPYNDEKNRYEYKYNDIRVTANDVVVEYLDSVKSSDIMNDFARFMGALYRDNVEGTGDDRVEEVKSITYNDVTYVWDAEKYNLKGSNWLNAGLAVEEKKGTLVETIFNGTGYETDGLKMFNQSLTFTVTKADNTTFTMNYNIVANANDSVDDLKSLIAKGFDNITIGDVIGDSENETINGAGMYTISGTVTLTNGISVDNNLVIYIPEGQTLKISGAGIQGNNAGATALTLIGEGTVEIDATKSTSNTTNFDCAGISGFGTVYISVDTTIKAESGKGAGIIGIDNTALTIDGAVVDVTGSNRGIYVENVTIQNGANVTTSGFERGITYGGGSIIVKNAGTTLIANIITEGDTNGDGEDDRMGLKIGTLDVRTGAIVKAEGVHISKKATIAGTLEVIYDRDAGRTEQLAAAGKDHISAVPAGLILATDAKEPSFSTVALTISGGTLKVNANNAIIGKIVGGSGEGAGTVVFGNITTTKLNAILAESDITFKSGSIIMNGNFVEVTKDTASVALSGNVILSGEIDVPLTVNETANIIITADGLVLNKDMTVSNGTVTINVVGDLDGQGKIVVESTAASNTTVVATDSSAVKDMVQGVTVSAAEIVGPAVPITIDSTSAATLEANASKYTAYVLSEDTIINANVVLTLPENITLYLNGYTLTIDYNKADKKAGELILDGAKVRMGVPAGYADANTAGFDGAIINVEGNLTLDGADVRAPVVEVESIDSNATDPYITILNAKTMKVSGSATAELEVGYGNTLVLADLTVPAGKAIKAFGLVQIDGTVTIQKGAQFNVYLGGSADITGELVIEGTANVNGAADITGTVKVYTKDGGASFNVGTTGVVDVAGTMDVLKGTNDKQNTLDVDSQKFNVIGTLTITGTLAGNVNDMGTVAFNGTAAGTDAKITIFDGMTITIASVNGQLTVEDDIDTTDFIVGKEISSASNKVTINNVKNVTVSTEVTETVEENASKQKIRYYTLNMTVSGAVVAVNDTVDDAKVTVENSATGWAAEKADDCNVTIGDITLGKAVDLEVKTINAEIAGTITVSAEGAGMTITGAVVDVTGTVVNVSGGQKSADTINLDAKVNAAKYTTEDIVNAISTIYYTTLENALAASASDADETIELLGTMKIESELEIPAGITLDTSDANVTIDVDGKITVAATAVLEGGNGTIDVDGMLVIMDKETGLNEPKVFTYQVLNETENTATYSGLVLALQNAVAGDVITLKQDADITKSVTIPEGVTLVVPKNVTLTIGDEKDDVTLTVAGTLKIEETVEAADDAQEVEIVITGVIIGADNIDETDLTMDDYVSFDMKIDGRLTHIHSNLAYAAANAVDGDVDIVGDVSGGDVTFTVADKKELEITVTPGSTLSVGTLTLVGAGASITTADAVAASGSTPAKEAGVITGTIAAAAGSVDLNKVSGITFTVGVETTVDASTDVVTIAGTPVGSFEVATGVITAADDFEMNATKDNKMSVSSGATLIVDNDFTATGVKVADDVYDVIIDGTISVIKNGKATIEYTTVNGTIDVASEGTLTITSATVNGTISVAEKTDDAAAGVANVNGALVLGAAPALGANGAFVGPVDIKNNANAFIIAYAGADVSAALIDVENGKSTAKSTEIVINGVPYMTVFVDKGVTVSLDEIEKYIDAEGFDNNTLEWAKEFENAYIGDFEVVEGTIEAKYIGLTVSAGVGLKVYIDGLAIENFKGYYDLNNNDVDDANEEGYWIQLGTHTVSFAVESGYDGANATITVNGVAVSNNGTFTLDVDDKSATIIASGAVPAQSGSTVVVDDADDGMALTDILLIVLVVLIVIMAIIVALRMMRS